MKQHKQDRRSQRTYHLVSTAMMELLAETRYDAITVQDILDRANIGRSTFYAHYYDKEDVLASITEQMLDLFSQGMQQAETGPGTFARPGAISTCETNAPAVSSFVERAKWRSALENGADSLKQKHRTEPDIDLVRKTLPFSST